MVWFGMYTEFIISLENLFENVVVVYQYHTEKNKTRKFFNQFFLYKQNLIYGIKYHIPVYIYLTENWNGLEWNGMECLQLL